MNLKGAEAARYAARPDPGRAGLLLAGADAMRVALKRAEAIKALVGPEGEAEMRLTRISAADLRKTPSLLADNLRAVGFFPGPRVVLVEDAADGAAEVIASALADWQAGDAVLVVTAGALTGKSTLKALFDKRGDCVSILFYDDPPGPEEISAVLAEAGLKDIPRATRLEIDTLARDLDPGDFRQTVEKMGLFKLGDPSPLTAEEIHALAPQTVEGDVDALILAVAGGEAARVGPLMLRLEGQGQSAVTICIRALQHFRALHQASQDPAGPVAFIARQRLNPRVKDAMGAQARRWGGKGLEQALALILETDLVLRSASRAPAMALMERALTRLAYMARARG